MEVHLIDLYAAMVFRQIYQEQYPKGHEAKCEGSNVLSFHFYVLQLRNVTEARRTLFVVAARRYSDSSSRLPAFKNLANVVPSSQFLD